MAGAIKISVDLSDNFDEFIITKEQAHAMTESALEDITNSFISAWKAEAKQALKGTRQDYVNSIKRIDKGRFEKAVVLVGQFNNMLEMGCSPFDMKAGFMKSTKKKIKADGGWYLTIPFRFATPNALGESSVFSGKLPQEIYAIAKKLSPTTESKQGGTLSLQDIPKSLQSIGVRKAVGGFGQYEHKNNIYEGLQRNEKTYEKSTQSTYTTFRRVSDKSNALAWIHSGIKAYDLANRALDSLDIETIVDNAVDFFISGNDIQKR